VESGLGIADVKRLGSKGQAQGDLMQTMSFFFPLQNKLSERARM
jgi:hypothetical protein